MNIFEFIEIQINIMIIIYIINKLFFKQFDKNNLTIYKYSNILELMYNK